MRKITKFPKLVVDEARKLKKFATPEELKKLNIENLDPKSGDQCIYGQMAGSCFSTRALHLIKNCAKRVYHKPSVAPTWEVKGPGRCRQLNGSPKNLYRSMFTQDFFSPIEVFIDRASKEMNAKLIAYLKGERKRLV
jgi:hypothetical protein